MLEVISKNFDFNLIDQAYSSNLAYLTELYKWMDIKIYFYLENFLKQNGEISKLDKYKGLVISRQEMADILDKIGEGSTYQTDAEEFIKHSEALKYYIDKRKQMTIKEGVFLPFAYLTHMFQLNEFEQHCLALSLLIHIDKKYEKVFGYLQDDITIKYPTLEIAIKLFNPNRTYEEVINYSLLFEKKLSKYFFMQPPKTQTIYSNLSLALQLDQRIRDFLFNDSCLSESKINSYLQVFYPDEALPDLIIGQDTQQKIRNISKDYSKYDNTIFYCFGPSGTGRTLQVKQLAKHLKKCVIFVDINELTTADYKLNEDNLNKTLREIILQDAIVCFTNFNRLIGHNNEISQLLADLLEAVRQVTKITFIISNEHWKNKKINRNYTWVELEFSLPDRTERSKLWSDLSRKYDVNLNIDSNELANKFSFSPGQIDNVINEAIHNTRGEDVKEISREILYKACYNQINHCLLDKSTRIDPKYKLQDLILPSEQMGQIINACNQVRFKHIVFDEWGFEEKLAYGKGLSMLFTGPPGTGKTMAAQVVAKELDLEIYKIDLSQIVSKYIGETEKNLKEIFEEAAKSNVILFFDETDALMGKRSEVKDAHDKYANLETAFLLQKIEEYDGISIMATNYLQNIDAAFLRRINYIIHFPFPDVVHREKIWRTIFPAKMPCSQDIDYGYLAKQFELAGGNIKNIALVAAFLAAENREAISMKHILPAIKNELSKQGKVLLREDFGEYGFYLVD